MIPVHLRHPLTRRKNLLLSSLLVCWIPLYLYDFLFILSMPTALLICIENTFWSRDDGYFVELFEKSFALYVESGMKKKIEADIVVLINQGGYLVTNEFKAKFKAEFCKIIMDHYLRKFHWFYLHLTHLTTFFSPLRGSSLWARTKNNFYFAKKVDAQNPYKEKSVIGWKFCWELNVMDSIWILWLVQTMNFKLKLGWCDNSDLYSDSNLTSAF